MLTQYNNAMTGLANAIRTKSGVSGSLNISEMTSAVNGISVGSSGSGASVSSAINFAKITKYTPYRAQLERINKVQISGFDDREDNGMGEAFRARLNGNYYLMPEYANETNWKECFYKHESQELYLKFHDAPTEFDDPCWGIYSSKDPYSYAYDSLAYCFHSEILKSGTMTWEEPQSMERWDITLVVDSEIIPEQQFELKGVKASSYDLENANYTWETSEINFVGTIDGSNEDFIIDNVYYMISTDSGNYILSNEYFSTDTNNLKSLALFYHDYSDGVNTHADSGQQWKYVDDHRAIEDWSADSQPAPSYEIGTFDDISGARISNMGDTDNRHYAIFKSDSVIKKGQDFTVVATVYTNTTDSISRRWLELRNVSDDKKTIYTSDMLTITQYEKSFALSYGGGDILSFNFDVEESKWIQIVFVRRGGFLEGWIDGKLIKREYTWNGDIVLKSAVTCYGQDDELGLINSQYVFPLALSSQDIRYLYNDTFNTSGGGEVTPEQPSSSPQYYTVNMPGNPLVHGVYSWDESGQVWSNGNYNIKDNISSQMLIYRSSLPAAPVHAAYVSDNAGFTPNNATFYAQNSSISPQEYGFEPAPIFEQYNDDNLPGKQQGVANILVTNAGTPICNGTYYYIGLYNDKPIWKKPATTTPTAAAMYLRWAGSNWQINYQGASSEHPITPLYCNTSSTNGEPNTGSWMAVKGSGTPTIGYVLP